jgi:hypothetical protein
VRKSPSLQRRRSPQREAPGASRLPPERAFVVQLASDASPDAWSGRVEHVVSGHCARFRALDQLVAFMRRWIAGSR